MSTEPAVMADKIFVTGKEWVEPVGEGACNLWFQLTVKVSDCLCRCSRGGCMRSSISNLLAAGENCGRWRGDG